MLSAAAPETQAPPAHRSWQGHGVHTNRCARESWSEHRDSSVVGMRVDPGAGVDMFVVCVCVCVHGSMPGGDLRPHVSRFARACVAFVMHMGASAWRASQSVSQSVSKSPQAATQQAGRLCSLLGRMPPLVKSFGSMAHRIWVTEHLA